MAANNTTLYILNEDNTIHWPNYKLYLEKNNLQRLKGPLPAPYSEYEVNAMCDMKGTDIPDALFHYLTKVSSCMSITRYPFKFNLDSLPTQEEAKKICIPYETTFLDEDSFYYRDEETTEAGFLDGDEFCRCMVRITDEGELSENIYLGSGAHYGSVWRYNNDNQIVWTKTKNTLDDFIIGGLNL